MGGGGRGGAKHKAPVVKETKSKKEEQAKLEEPTGANVIDMESKFMQALQKEMGDVEITEESVREHIAKMTPEQKTRLATEGQDLKQELLTNGDHEAELDIFRKELNTKAAAAGLPVEKDGEHLGKKLLGHMRTSTEAPSHLLVLEAIASSPFLVKLAVTEMQQGAPRADADDLVAVEAALRTLKVNGWQSPEQETGRPPFVRRNLLLLHFVLYNEKIELSIKPSTQHALSELSAKVATICDMLFQYCLQNRWVKAALTVTELQGLLVNGLWDHKDDECRDLMLRKFTRQSLKLPKLSLAVSAADVEPGHKTVIKVEVTRLHAYSEDELAAALKLGGATAATAAAAAEQQATAEAPAEVPAPQEGWWVVAEGLRSKRNKDEKMGEVELSHNSLVGRQALACALDAPVMSAEISFEAPTTPGEYKVMVHVRSSGCVGVDVRRKVTFTVKEPKRVITPKPPAAQSAAPAEAAAAEAVDDVPQLE